MFPLIIVFWSLPLDTQSAKWIRRIICISLVADILLASLILPWNVIKTAEVKYQLAQLSASKDTMVVDFSFFRSNRIRLMENHIPFKEQDLPDTNSFHLVHSYAKFVRPGGLQNLPMPLLIQWTTKFKDRFRRRQ
jgi:hypothetical protein